jgi:hypothetical protein
MQHGIKQAKDSDSIGKLFAAYLRRAEESTLGGVLVEITILHAVMRQNAMQVLRDAATAYKVDADAIPTDIDSAEAELTNEIGKLWQVHTEAQTSVRKSRDELKLIRTSLSRKLHELKAVLSRPGRGGAWSSFLWHRRSRARRETGWSAHMRKR